MTDNYGLIPNRQGVTSDCLYNMKASAVKSRSMRCSIVPTNKSVFNPNDVAILYIPAGRRNTFLDPTQTYLRMTVKNYDVSNNLIMDGTAAGFINRIDCYHSSNLLESIQQYNVLFQYLVDFSVDNSYKQGAFAWGCTSDRSGVQINKATSASAVPSQATFCLPIVSGIFGTLCEKMLPIGQMGDDLRIEITFENHLTGCLFSGSSTGTYTTAGSPAGYAWQISNLELVTCIVELSDEGMSMVNEVTPFNQPVYIHSSSYRHFTSVVPANSSGVYTTLVPARFSSLRSIHLCPRRSTEITSLNSYSLSSRANPQFANCWYRLGAYLVPQKPINLINAATTGNFNEAFMETLRSFHSLNNYLVSSSITYAYYNVNDANPATGDGSVFTVLNTDVNSYKNAFALGLELESFAQRSDVLISGVNTLSTQVFFEANIAATAPTSSYTLNFFAFFDQIVVLDQSILSVKF